MSIDDSIEESGAKNIGKKPGDLASMPHILLTGQAMKEAQNANEFDLLDSILGTKSGIGMTKSLSYDEDDGSSESDLVSYGTHSTSSSIFMNDEAETNYSYVEENYMDHDGSLSDILELESESSYCETLNNTQVSIEVDVSFFSAADDEVDGVKNHGLADTPASISMDNPISKETLETILENDGEEALDRALMLRTSTSEIDGNVFHADLCNQFLRNSLKSTIVALRSASAEKRCTEASMETRMEKSIEVESSLDEANELVQSLRKRLKEKECDAMNLKDEILKGTSRNKELNGNLSSLQDKNDKVDFLLEKSKNECLQSQNKCEHLEKSHEVLKDKLSNTQDRHREAENFIVKTKSDLSTAQAEVMTLTRSAEEQSSERKIMRDDLGNTYDKIFILQDDLKLQVEKCAAKNLLLEESRSELSSLKFELESKESRSDMAERGLEDAREHIDFVKKTFAATKQTLEEELKHLQVAIAENGTELESQRKQSSRSHQFQSELEEEIRHGAEELSSIRKSLHKTNTELQVERGALCDTNNELSRSRKKCKMIEEELCRTLDETNERQERSNMKIRLLKNDFERSQQKQKKRMFSSENYCCFFPFRQRSSTSIITSDVNEAYEEIVCCMENALRCDAAEIILSGDIIAELLDDPGEEHDFYLHGSEIIEGDVQAMNDLPLRPYYKELSRRIIFYYRRNCQDFNAVDEMPRSILGTDVLNLVHDEISTNNCLEWLQNIGEEGIVEFLGLRESDYVPPYLEADKESLSNEIL